MSSLLRGLLERCFSAERLDKLFESHAQEQYTRSLLFSTACDLLLLTVLRVHPSVHAAYQAQEGLNFSPTALYDKLSGVETGVSAAMVRETAKDLSQVQDALGVRRESWLPGYEIRIVDGNCLEASEKRLRVHRGVGSAPLPGSVLDVDLLGFTPRHRTHIGSQTGRSRCHAFSPAWRSRLSSSPAA